MTSPNLLAHLRRASSSISSLPATASPAKPMAQSFDDLHYVDLRDVLAFGSRRPQRSIVCSTMATHMVPTLGRSGSVRGVY
mmetsp:Transcript_25064/g.63587  ORF Transcript_25064/g.63587 Transcript_25064/m.63587 type:complete len:81 (+) Transcript_25064:53-295(+)